MPILMEPVPLEVMGGGNFHILWIIIGTLLVFAIICTVFAGKMAKEKGKEGEDEVGGEFFAVWLALSALLLVVWTVVVMSTYNERKDQVINNNITSIEESYNVTLKWDSSGDALKKFLPDFQTRDTKIVFPGDETVYPGVIETRHGNATLLIEEKSVGQKPTLIPADQFAADLGAAPSDSKVENQE